VLFSLVAAEAAARLGEWPAILGGTAVWAAAMFIIGPVPSMHVHLSSHKAALAVIATSLAVLGASETFVFVPFVPLLHAHLRGPEHGWAAEDAEDAVAALWTTGGWVGVGIEKGGWMLCGCGLFLSLPFWGGVFLLENVCCISNERHPRPDSPLNLNQHTPTHTHTRTHP
jgi:hypothetical protein